MTQKMKLKSDEGMNPQLQEEVQELRGGIVGTAESHPLPARFKVTKDEKYPRMHILDTETGRKTWSPLFAYSDVRIVLNDLFG